MSPAFHRGGLHFEQAHGRFTTIDPSTGTRRWPIRATTGGFATIDPRHAGDTPQSSAYGSNSPQATNENKPHHHDKQTKTCRTRPTQPPKEHAALALPSNRAGGFTTIDPRHAGDTPQSSAYGSNSPQATNENKPHHQDNWTRMSNTTHATTPPQTSATASPTETPQTPHVTQISLRWTAL